MSDVSNACEEVIRKFHGKVEITWTDPYIDASIAVSANDENYGHSLSDSIEQVANLKEIIPKNWAHLDDNFKANGTFYPAPGTNLTAVNNEIGWWGGIRCNSNGEWIESGSPTTTTIGPAANPILTIIFASRSIHAINVVGNNYLGEYPVSFIVRIYTLSGDAVPVLTETVTNGVGAGWSRSKVIVTDATAVKWIKSLDPVIGSAQKMELEIVKWSTGFRVVKIAEFYTSIVETYTDNDILSLKLTEESDIAEGTIPIGNISCNELDLKLQNIDDQFFIGNTDSPIYTLLKKNRRIRAWIGIEIANGSTEYILLGTFFSGDWDAPELATFARTSARDRMELLRTSDFEISELYEDITLYDLAGLVLDDAVLKIPDLVYNIDITLDDFTLPYAWFEKQSYFQCIKDIVGACMGRAYMDRNDVLQLGTDL